MRFLLRCCMVLALLTGLAFGSYSFGKYVLSNKLFGSAGKPAADAATSRAKVAHTLTRQATLRGGKPQVEVQILPAQIDGPGPEPPSFDVTSKEMQDEDDSDGSSG